MLCLSIQQPWAWALFNASKRIENRDWQTFYRGPLLIHAGKSLDRMGLVEFPDGILVPNIEHLPFGAVIGRVELIDCVEFQRVAGADPWAEGPWCWVFRRPQLLDCSVPYRGKPGLFHAELRAEDLVFLPPG